ncbi:hypothetical protein [uncultured Gimesia sp.]|nr:hypothetical protein [uncultured Gimesia sp.]
MRSVVWKVAFVGKTHANAAAAPVVNGTTGRHAPQAIRRQSGHENT